MELIKVKNYEELSEKAGSIIVERIQALDNPVLGLATGSTPEGLYTYLIEKYKQGELSFQNITTFNLDEYVGLREDDINSYHYFMKEKLFNHVDLNDEKAHVPDGNVIDLEKECQAYEQKIREHGNIDIQVLGVGVNGHIGFNEPGTAFSSRTHLVELTESTRQANARFFSSIDEVPTMAITMGIETIMDSKMIVFLVSGESKAETLARIMNGEVSEDCPASILRTHPNTIVIADEAACSKL